MKQISIVTNKYHNDTKFRSYVEELMAFLSQDHSLSDYELREAVIMASIFHTREKNYKTTNLQKKERLYDKIEKLELLMEINKLIETCREDK